ncbi:MAG: bifunctional nuclease family protein [Acidobacteriota bacterium]|nr:bifunctional nuclease family protein [Acidobacteriota bacterium]MDH3786018.1 bifunctional nuclease family protein [Acidobacteriota bacterium]
MSIEMKIKGLMIDPVSNMPIIVLRSEDGNTVLPIWVGIFEANAIAIQMENIVSPRPMTHDLLKNVIDGLDAEIERVVITDLKENTFYATIHIRNRNGEGSLLVDARPSDAMALALRANAVIQVEETVLDKSTTDDSTSAQETERLRRWLETVDPEELGKYEM